MLLALMLAVPIAEIVEPAPAEFGDVAGLAADGFLGDHQRALENDVHRAALIALTKHHRFGVVPHDWQGARELLELLLVERAEQSDGA